MTVAVIKDKFKELKLYGMLEAYITTIETGKFASLTSDEMLNYLVEAEWLERKNRKLKRLLMRAKFKLRASIEEIDLDNKRNIDKNLLMRIANCSFLDEKENIVITGSTGVGKSYLASAIGHQACHKGYSVMYFSTSKLLSKLKMSKADNSYIKEMRTIAKQNLIILDDFGLQPFDQESKFILLEIIEDRHAEQSTIFTSQFPVAKWHEIIDEPTIADAIMDRIVYSSHRIELKGESMRKIKSKIKKGGNKK